tara:strand:+ start:6467 stop:6634 length:168 start_codon:yes stop_codon:yes gene_type:complete
MRKENFTEEQIEIIESVCKDSHEKGVVFGLVLSMGLIVLIYIVYSIALKFDLLFH